MSKARDLADFQGSASALTTGTLPVDRVPYVGRRNLIINGGFDVWQRSTDTTAGGEYTSVDRWYAINYTDAWGVSTDNRKFKFVDTDGTSVFNITGSANGTRFYFGQRIENGHKIFNKQLTLSFYIKVDSGTLDLTEVAQTKHNGTIEVQGSAYTVTSEWQKVTLTFTHSSGIIGVGSPFQIELLSNVNLGTKTLSVKEVQLELGSVATPFEHRSYGEELALCQRYYEVVNYYARCPAGYNYRNYPWRVIKRASPSISVTVTEQLDGSTHYGTNATDTQFNTAHYSGGGGSGGLGLTIKGDAEL